MNINKDLKVTKMMKEETKLQRLLPIGLYKLTNDVHNPHPDSGANQHRLSSFKQVDYLAKRLKADL